MDIASKVIAEKGFSNATVRDIGEEAGVLSGSLYYHFTSKEALLEEFLRAVMDDLVAAYEAAEKIAAGPREAVERLIATGIDFVAEQPAAAKILQNDFAYLRQTDRFEFVNERNSRIRKIWRATFQRAVEQGVFRSDVDLDLAYRMTMGAILSTVRWFDPNGRKTKDDISADLARLLLDGVSMTAST